MPVPHMKTIIIQCLATYQLEKCIPMSQDVKVSIPIKFEDPQFGDI